MTSSPADAGSRSLDLVASDGTPAGAAEQGNKSYSFNAFATATQQRFRFAPTLPIGSGVPLSPGRPVPCISPAADRAVAAARDRRAAIL